MRHVLYLLDVNGNPATAINGVPIDGPLPTYKGLSYTSVGAAIDKTPTNKVSVPLTEWRNTAVGTNTQIAVVDTDIGSWPSGEVTRGPVIDETITVDSEGISWASLTFADTLYELAEVDTTSGFSSSQNETLTTTGTRLLGLANHPWQMINDVAGLARRVRILRHN
ncbi:MAG: hypothetical protein LC793_08380 [Thermomicrobia bacterium]|nr:hypothetical protein [Thermomicrobia bacterium]